MKQLFFILFMVTALSSFAQEYRLEGSEVKIDAAIRFETATAKFLPETDAALQIIKKYLDDKTYISLLRVEGHTESSSDETADQKLAEARALAVCRRLVQLGVDCKRLIAVGFGSQKPIADNDTPEGRNANRRISFINAALRGHLIGGLPADGGGKVAGESCE
jgi:OOP family OmpA-OmpF porin